ncbi:MAG: sugar-transfer associated ATP-grasp domain-containing protein [Candidatus Absconditabacterales bacterium]
MFDFGILGNNSRNLNYIKKFNDRKSIYLANNKLETKKFLSERGIPFAKTYAVIKSRKELYDFDFSNLPNKNFVVKPNHGSKGEGVLIVKSLKNIEVKKSNRLIENFKTPSYKKTGNFLIGNKQIDESKFKRYLLDIIGGKYSMTNGNDQIIVEEKLIAGESFKDFCQYGLADIRVIVFNLVPVAGMIRMPTINSGGKANLAQGGMGFGIEIGTGKIKSMLKKNKILTSNFPLEYSNFLNKKIPYRNDILFLSSKIQFFVNLGYLALDWVITQDGPKLLEINARAGLEVQKVSNIRLKKILEKISDLKIIDPEKGVEIAKTLFTPEKTNLNANKILYLSQNGKLTYKSENIENVIDVIVQVDLNKQESQISQSLCEKLNCGKKLKFNLDIYDNEISFKQIKLNKSEQIQGNKIIIGKNLANEYLIKPHHKIFENIEILNPTKIIKAEIDLLKQIDQKIEKTSKKLILANKLRPLNYFEELDNFNVEWEIQSTV